MGGGWVSCSLHHYDAMHSKIDMCFKPNVAIVDEDLLRAFYRLFDLQVVLFVI